MLRIKRLYSFVFEAFLPLLLVTFGVCLFILLMQFLWKYVDDMVGKGIDMIILAKMFFYAAVYLIPMTLPLAVLLASLMTFGNLGEHLELLAMKSAGVSLFRIMRPLIIAMSFIAIASFYFQNVIGPATHARFWTIVLSIKQKSPELSIPEGIFHKDIPGYNVYVRHKDKKGGMMREMTIYNFSKGFDNTTVIVADSGKLKVSDDKLYLILTLYSGESFENYVSKNRVRSANEKIPYRRETFSLKEILIKWDTNFNMADESIMQDRDGSKGLNELTQLLDSTKMRSDSINLATKDFFVNRVYGNTFKESSFAETYAQPVVPDTVKIGEWDDYFTDKDLSAQKELVDRAKNRLESMYNDFRLETLQQSDRLQKARGHEIEIHRRFSLSLACLIFFFIGGPLGAIIRKGGLGMPAVLSLFLFLLYYTIDIFGLKMSRQGVWPIWQGMWLSTLVLSLLGIFLTYKAVNDSVMMNPDVWKDFFRRFFGKRDIRNYQQREVIITPPDYEKDSKQIAVLTENCKLYLNKRNRWPGYISFWKKGFRDNELLEIISREEELIDDMRNSTENLILGKLMDYPIIRKGYSDFLDHRQMRSTCAVIFPFGIAIYLISMHKQKYIRQDIRTICKINDELMKELQSMTGNQAI